ncbi:MAG: MarR family transcriptional regulator [Kofleriaceae bacterium]
MLPEDAIAQDILRTIRQVVRQISIHSKQLQRDVGLSVPQLLCLQAIADGPVAAGTGAAGVTLGDVSDRVQLGAPTVSRIIDRLIAANLVARERGTDDRRKVQITLTEAGQARVAALPTPLQTSFLERLARLGDDERRHLRDALAKVAELMSASELDAAPLLSPDDPPQA